MRHPALVSICVLAAMVLLFSCDSGNSTPEAEPTVSRVDLTIAAETIGTGVQYSQMKPCYHRIQEKYVLYRHSYSLQ